MQDQNTPLTHPFMMVGVYARTRTDESCVISQLIPFNSLSGCCSGTEVQANGGFHVHSRQAVINLVRPTTQKGCTSAGHDTVSLKLEPKHGESGGGGHRLKGLLAFRYLRSLFLSVAREPDSAGPGWLWTCGQGG